MKKIIFRNNSSLTDSEALLFAGRSLLKLTEKSAELGLDKVDGIVLSVDERIEFYTDELKSGTRRIFVQQNLPF